MTPWGLNNQGHILFTTYGDNSCGKLWLWDGSAAHVILDYPDTLTYSLTRAHSHLNDADHIAINHIPNVTACSPEGFTVAGILTGTQFTPITAGDALQINNHDQVLMLCTINGEVFLKLWDGTSVVDLGFGGYSSMNDRGQVVFLVAPWTAPGLKIYKDGLVSDLNLLIPETLGIGGGYAP